MSKREISRSSDSDDGQISDVEPRDVGQARIKIFDAAQRMPKGNRAQELLHHRAAAAARIQQEEDTKIQPKTYLKCRLGANEQVGIPYCYLDEIIYANEITAIPSTPAHIAGVVNRRGQLLTILDTQCFFFFYTTNIPETNDECRIVVASYQGKTIGLLVSEVRSNEFYLPQDLTPPLRSNCISRPDYVKGLYQGKIAMLDIVMIFDDEGLVIDGTL